MFVGSVVVYLNRVLFHKGGHPTYSRIDESSVSSWVYPFQALMKQTDYLTLPSPHPPCPRRATDARGSAVNSQASGRSQSGWSSWAQDVSRGWASSESSCSNQRETGCWGWSTPPMPTSCCTLGRVWGHPAHRLTPFLLNFVDSSHPSLPAVFCSS